MSQAIMISDGLYSRLKTTSQSRGLHDIEQLLEQWQAQEDELYRRREVVRQIHCLRERLLATYGAQPDSVELLRADRAR